MAEAAPSALEIIALRIKELDAIVQSAGKDLNTVAAKERIAKWKTQTLPLLAQYVGDREAKQFWKVEPGPSFTNDLLEELTEEAETYRNALTALAGEIKNKGGA